MLSEDALSAALDGCHGLVSLQDWGWGVGGVQGLPQQQARGARTFCRMPDPFLGSSQVTPTTAFHAGARYRSTRVRSGLEGGCRFYDAKAEAGLGMTCLRLLAQH